MVDSKFFGIPFAVSGDKATIPEDTQPSGAISYQQGYGPDYERDPETDPLAKRVPRDETNELYYQITNAMRFLQLYGTPEWYAVDDNGDPVSYPLSARVRHDAGAGMHAWRSLIASNTTVPGANPAHWTLDEPFSFEALEASLAEALAGTSALKLITPRRLSSSVQRNAWNTGTAGAAGDTILLTLAPAPAALPNGMTVTFLTPSGLSGSVIKLNVNGFGTDPLQGKTGQEITAAQLIPGISMTATRSGSSWLLQSSIPRDVTASNIQVFNTAGTTNFTVPQGVYRLFVEVYGGGGGAAVQGFGTGTSHGEGGGGGGHASGFLPASPGQVLSVVVGAAGSNNTTGGNATAGGSSSVGGVSATGGAGATSAGNPGAGGVGSSGSINLSGGPGWDGNDFLPQATAIGGDAAGPHGGKGARVQGSAATWPGGGGMIVVLGGSVFEGAPAAGGVIIRW